MRLSFTCGSPRRIAALALMLVHAAAPAADDRVLVPVFAASVPAPMTLSAQPLAELPDALPAGLQWIALAPDSDPHAPALAAVQAPDGVRLYARARGGGHWTLRWSTLMQLNLPAIGWQRAPEPLLSAADCDRLNLSPEDRAYCPAWWRAQQALRARIVEAFKPGYRIEGAQGERLPLSPWPTMAASLYTNAAADYRELDPPSAGPLRSGSEGEDQLYALTIPWAAWPLTYTPTVSALYLQGEYCPALGDCVPLAAGPDTALALQLPAPLRLQPSACEPEVPTYSDGSVLYLRIADSVPGNVPATTRLMSFQNPGGGYLDRPDPDRLSPELWAVEFSITALEEPAQGWFLCGPNGRLWNGAAIRVAATELDDEQRARLEADGAESGWSGSRHPAWEADTPRYREVWSMPTSFDPRRLDAHRLLLVQSYQLDAPISGEGANGACDRAQFALWLVDTDVGTLRRALSLDGYGADLCAGSALVSAVLSEDGRAVDSVRWEYDPEAPLSGSGLVETRDRHCLDEVSNSYLLCRRERRAIDDPRPDE